MTLVSFDIYICLSLSDWYDVSYLMYREKYLWGYTSNSQHLSMQDINTERVLTEFGNIFKLISHFVLGGIYNREDLFSNTTTKQRKTSALT